MDTGKKQLHGGSVTSLDELLNPRRGENSPHPFYVKDKSQRDDVIEFLRGLEKVLTKEKIKTNNKEEKILTN